MEKKICEVRNVVVRVVERESKKTGEPYKIVVADINGVEVNLGFFNVFTENAFLHAGVKFNG